MFLLELTLKSVSKKMVFCYCPIPHLKELTKIIQNFVYEVKINYFQSMKNRFPLGLFGNPGRVSNAPIPNQVYVN